jgi:anti-sigma-K factor RskA
MDIEAYISSGILELYAAGVLPPEEMKEVEDMVAAHPRLAEELDAIQQALVSYAGTQTTLKPKEETFDKILDRIHAEPQPVVATPAPEAKTVNIKKEKQKEKPIERERETERERGLEIGEKKKDTEERASGGGGRVFLIAASFILLALSVALNAYLYNQWQGTKNDLTALQSENNRMAHEFSTTKTMYAESQQKLDVLTDPQYKTVMMKGIPAMSPQSEAMVYWNPNKKAVFLNVHSLPAPPAGKQYQLWALDSAGKPMDAGMLAVDAKPAELHPMKDISGATAFAITLEPMGGSVSPTLDQMYVMGKLN